MRVRYTGHEEVVEAGDACYDPGLRSKHLAKDYKTLPETAVAMIYAAMS
jgi:hypothetical protein